LIHLFDDDILDRLGILDKSDYFKRSLATLGGGNHFIELGVDEYNCKWITIHSGSRNYGLQIAQHHQNKAVEFCTKNFIDVPKGMEFLSNPEDISLYLDDMERAQRYASLSRTMIIHNIVQDFFGYEPESKQLVSCIHNYIDTDSKIIRKGAIDASLDKKCIIPFNMEDGIIIGKGLGNNDWNNSAPHGAGRVYSRAQAKKCLNLDEAKKSMKDAGVYTTSLNMNSLDEAKLAYKPMEDILSVIKDTVEITNIIKPIYNFKAS
jgi:RNA-splicing ligase RtcB